MSLYIIRKQRIRRLCSWILGTLFVFSGLLLIKLLNDIDKQQLVINQPSQIVSLFDFRNNISTQNDKQNDVNNVIPNPIMHEDSQKPDRLSMDHIAIAIKTGHEVALDRVPVQLLTFLKDAKNMIVIGDAPGIEIGSMPMHDVITKLYDFESVNVAAVPKPEVKLEKRGAAANVIVPDTKSRGWRMDAHKNLPGFRLLYEKFPNARWYMMIDDDTYLYTDNLIQEVERLNWNDDYYMGAPNKFKGCDGVKDIHQSPLFAHGGSGILISSGAMKKLVEPININRCISKYKTCWAGDIRTALCLRDLEITITKMSGFRGMPPTAEFRWSHPCDRPITWHHLPSQRIQRLYSSELKGRRVNGVTLADVFWDEIVPQLPVDSPLLKEQIQNVDFPDAPVYRVIRRKDANLEGPALCKNTCRGEERCITWVWDGEKCWLKGGLGGKILEKDSALGYVSGVFMKKYKCVQ
ncbi:hypothetical protein HK098_004270 [Nowakowskiella sp. JEL0407]|nr:hypothetical protein HK098_004270 [Nowakowskiella sp. JEL0407]